MAGHLASGLREGTLPGVRAAHHPSPARPREEAAVTPRRKSA